MVAAYRDLLELYAWYRQPSNSPYAAVNVISINEVIHFNNNSYCFYNNH